MGILGKLVRSVKNPKRATEITFARFDEAAGKKLFGNTAGLKRNLGRSSKLQKLIDPELRKTNPQLYHLIKDGNTPFQNSYNESMISNIKEKYNKLIENDEYSFPVSGYEDKIFHRALDDPAKNLPEIAQLITEDVKSLLYGYYNSHFTIQYIIITRNYYLPEDLRKEEMYSNVWHCDHSNTSGVKYFVYLSDVTEEDGPLHIQSISRTKQLIKMGFGNRDHYDLPLEVVEDPSHVVKMTGPAGTSFLGNVTRCLHRAGFPEKGHIRDMVQFYIESSDVPLPKDWIKNALPWPSIRHYIPKKKPTQGH